jgi:uncharacterized tellurite resistance protein B-like protein
MRLRRLLGAIGLGRTGEERAVDPFLRSMEEALARFGPERLEYLAGFAGQLARVAHVDGGISPAEAKRIGASLAEHASVTAEESEIVVGILRHEFEVLRSLQPHVLSRAINAHASPEEKAILIDCLYAVGVADHLVSDVEELEIRRVADALLVPHRALMDIRARYRDRIEALQGMPRAAPRPKG